MNKNALYILPNLFTVGSIFLGIWSIILASDGDFEMACLLVLFSAILDGLDGRIARLTGTSSKFGVELDSLADIVAFGVAPAFILYFYVGQNYGRMGMAVSAIFVILGAVRLARFNIANPNVEPNSFIGLPIPSAGIALSFWILNDIEYGILLQHNLGFLLLIFAFLLAILMVSNIRYSSFKKMKFNLRTLILLILVLILAFLSPYEVIGASISLYIFFGLLRFIFLGIKILFRKRAS
ncbi:MAG: CDP-diacylglycerol--serine O-phosphatidyltransferase [Helicobacter sp.]|nr:CDP-diacylglycerol--serine O-phosphatidyltransferase [Helicobacter sp.]